MTTMCYSRMEEAFLAAAFEDVSARSGQVNIKIALVPGEADTISMSLALPDWIEAVDVLIDWTASHEK